MNLNLNFFLNDHSDCMFVSFSWPVLSNKTPRFWLAVQIHCFKYYLLCLAFMYGPFNGIRDLGPFSPLSFYFPKDAKQKQREPKRYVQVLYFPSIFSGSVLSRPDDEVSPGKTEVCEHRCRFSRGFKNLNSESR